MAEIEGKGIKERKDTKRKKERVEEVTVIVRMIEEKQEEDLIEIRMVKGMIPRRFYKYLKVFEKKESERMPMSKT